MTKSIGGIANDRLPTTADPGVPALYVNYFEVGHNPFEFLIDLGQYHPGSNEAEGRIAIYTRIATAPPFAKMLSDLLARAVQEHENQHGQIPVICPQTNPFDIVLSSLGEFEERARALRARQRSEHPAPSDIRPSPADGSGKTSRSRKGR